MQQVIQRLIGALQRSFDLLLNTPTGRLVGVGLLVLVAVSVELDDFVHQVPHD